MNKENWIIYALGSGFGHMTRAISLGRIAARAHHVEILCNSPYVPYLQQSEGWRLEQERLDLVLTTLPSRLSTNFASERDEFVEHVSMKLADPKWDKLIVDTFPRGMLGEFVDVFEDLSTMAAQLRPQRILISRALNERYREKYKIDEFVRNNYHLVIEPGDVASRTSPDSACRTIHTAPWMVRDATELPLRENMREKLGVRDSNPLILVVASGTEEELNSYWEIARRASRQFDRVHVRCLAPSPAPNDLGKSLWIAHWPGIECIVAADVVVGGAGYNTISECSVLGVPLISIPFKRLYDCQHLRAQQATWRASEASQVLDFLSHFLSSFKAVRSQPSYSNGAADAYLRIYSELLSPKGIPV